VSGGREGAEEDAVGEQQLKWTQLGDSPLQHKAVGASELEAAPDSCRHGEGGETMET